MIDAILKGIKPKEKTKKEEPKTNFFAKILGILSFIKNKFIGMIVDLGRFITKSLGPIIDKLASKLGISSLGAGAGFAAASVGAGVAGVALATNEQIKSTESAKKGDVSSTITAQRRSAQYLQGGMSEFQDESVTSANAKMAARTELEHASKMGSAEAKASLVKMDAQENKTKKMTEYLKALDYQVGEGGPYLAKKKGTGFLGIGGTRVSNEDLDAAKAYASGKISLPKKKLTTQKNELKDIPKSEQQIYNKLVKQSDPNQIKDPMYLQSLKEEAHMQAMQTSAAIPTVTPPSPLGFRAVAATKENQNLVGPSNAPAAPIIINKPTNVVNNGGSMGGTGGGMVRNDDAVLTRLQFQSMRPV